MSGKVTVLLFLVTFGTGWCMTALESQCVANFNEDLSNDSLEGTWYYVMLFTLMGVTLPTSECPTYIYQKPNSTELERYKEEYLKPNIPYSFDDTPIHEDGGPFRPLGLMIGNKQAKFFIMDPNTHFYRPLFEVRIYQRINDDFVLYQDCVSRGHRRWLMSRNRNPSREEVEAIVNSRKDIADMRRQWYCYRF